MPETRNVKQDLELLKKCQHLDKEIYDLNQTLLAMPAEIQASEMEFERVKQKVKLLEDKVRQSKLKQKEKELELGQKEEHILKRQGQLNLVKTNEEYSAMRSEISSMKADNSLLEEAILLLMDEVEQAEKELGTEKQVLKEQEKKLSERKAELAEKEKICRTKMEELKSVKKDVIAQVHSEISSLYERILAKKNGIALARIDSENCSSCHMKLRPQVLNEVKMQEAVVMCENCTCILYEEV